MCIRDSVCSFLKGGNRLTVCSLQMSLLASFRWPPNWFCTSYNFCQSITCHFTCVLLPFLIPSPNILSIAQPPYNLTLVRSPVTFLKVCVSIFFKTFLVFVLLRTSLRAAQLLCLSYFWSLPLRILLFCCLWDMQKLSQLHWLESHCHF